MPDPAVAAPAAPATPVAPAPKVAPVAAPAPKAVATPAPATPAADPKPPAASVANPVAPAKTGESIIDKADPADDLQGAATWPDDWRDQIAGGDEKSLSLLKRYSSPSAVFNALRAAQAKISSGEYKKGLAKDATPDEIASYRKEQGIPEEASGYELPKGLEVSETDKPIVDGFLEFAHGKNYSPSQVQDVVNWWYQAQEQAAGQAHEADQQFTQENDDALRKEWGNEYRGNINALKNWLTTEAPEGIMDNLFGGRLANGRPIGSDASTLRWLVSVMKDVNPAATVTGTGEYQGGKGLEERKAAIEASWKTPEGYNAYMKDTAKQEEYRGIIGAIEKLSARTKKAA
jgi:hypothetical protein